MGLRARRFVAMIGLVLFLAGYVWAVIAIGERLPDNKALDLLFYGVAGIAWGLPLGPLFAWTEGGKKG